VLAATHANIEEGIVAGTFREDLFYRLNVVTIDVPSLADRTSDIPELVMAFSASLERKLTFDAAALEWLQRRRWPGNIRELRNVVERLALLADKSVIDVRTLEDLAAERRRAEAVGEIDRIARDLLALPDRVGSKLRAIERAVLHHAVESCGGNKSAAARLIGVDRKALERRWERYGAEGEADGEEPDTVPD
jgi:DNA-binding NtrC family response regulator